jgi:DNA-binding CsgD family transcriptional regulator
LLTYISVVFCYVFPHIARTLRLYPERLRWIHLLGTSITSISGSVLIGLMLFAGLAEKWSLVFFFIAMTYALSANFVILRTFLVTRKSIIVHERNKYLFYFFLVASALASGAVSGFPGMLRLPFASAALFNFPLLAVMLAYGFFLLRNLDVGKSREIAAIADRGSIEETDSEDSASNPRNIVWSRLPIRQRTIIILLKQGKTRKEISDKMGISMNTIKTHISRMFLRYNVQNKVELLNVFYSIDRETKKIAGVTPQAFREGGSAK